MKRKSFNYEALILENLLSIVDDRIDDPKF